MKAAVDVPNKIIGETCKTVRPLWEEVFYEDSAQFTDYYFENKAERNIGYVIGQAPYDAMMFRTPYNLQIGEQQRNISYIVGVATRKECRHRGYMRALLIHSFKEMYQEKNSFTFLMPANPAIYEPFDFQYVYERENWALKEQQKTIMFLEMLTAGKNTDDSIGLEKTVKGKNDGNSIELETSMKSFRLKEIVPDLWKKETKTGLRAAEFISEATESYRKNVELNGLYSVRSLKKQFPELPIMELLAEFANQYLKANYNIYVHRDAAYYEMQLKESAAQNGDIYVLFEQGKIKAFFLYAKEGDEVFIQEVMEEIEGTLDFLQKAEKKKPIIMARIIHLEEMMTLVCSKENTNMMIEIKDELIPENAGIFQWEMTPKGSKVTKVQSKIRSNKSVKVMEKKDAVSKEGVMLNIETVENSDIVPKISMHIRDFAEWVLTGVFINEIV